MFDYILQYSCHSQTLIFNTYTFSKIKRRNKNELFLSLGRHGANLNFGGRVFYLQRQYRTGSSLGGAGI